MAAGRDASSGVGPGVGVSTRTRAAERVHLITATVAMDGSLLDAAVAAGADGIVVAATGRGQHGPACCWPRPSGRWRPGSRWRWRQRCVAGRAGAGYAFPGGGATWVRAGALPVGHLCAVKARVALALGLGAGLDRAGLAALLADPARRLTRCRSTRLITGRIATLAGDRGFGWVEAIGIRDGRSRSPAPRSRSRRGRIRSRNGSRWSPTRWRSRD